MKGEATGPETTAFPPSRSGKLLSNAFAVLAGKLSYTVQILASVPLFLAHWTVEIYGAWLVLTAIPAWLVIADVGIGTAGANEMTFQAGGGNWVRANQAFRCACCAMMAVLGLGVVLLGLFAWWAPWSRYMELGEAIGNANWVVVFSGLMVLGGLPTELGRGIFRCGDKAATASAWTAAKPVIDLAALFIALRLGAGPAEAALALLVSQCVFVSTFLLAASRVSPQLKLAFRDIEWDHVRRLIRLGIGHSLFPLGHSVAIQGSVVVVQAIFGPAQVVVFGTARTLSRLAYQGTTLIYATVLPEMGRVMGSGDSPRAKRLHRLSVVGALLLSAGATALVIAVGPAVYHLWTGGRLEASRALLLAFGAAVVLNAVWVGSSVVQTATNRHEPLSWSYLGGTIGILVLATVLAGKVGLEGTAWVLALVDVALVPWVLATSLALTGDTWPRFWREIPSSVRDAWTSVAGVLSRQNRTLA